MNPVKLATYNINGIRSRLPRLLDWLKRESPDIVCLQELKAEASDFPDVALRSAGYEARNYAGSWHEWSRYDELPLER